MSARCVSKCQWDCHGWLTGAPREFRECDSLAFFSRLSSKRPSGNRVERFFIHKSSIIRKTSRSAFHLREISWWIRLRNSFGATGIWWQDSILWLQMKLCKNRAVKSCDWNAMRCVHSKRPKEKTCIHLIRVAWDEISDRLNCDRRSFDYCILISQISHNSKRHKRLQLWCTCPEFRNAEIEMSRIRRYLKQQSENYR